jgi:hypothetical protein
MDATRLIGIEKIILIQIQLFPYHDARPEESSSWLKPRSIDDVWSANGTLQLCLIFRAIRELETTEKICHP